MKRGVFLCLFLLTALIVITVAQLFVPPRDDGAGKQAAFVVEQGQGVFSVATRLEEEGIIRNRVPLLVSLFATGDWRKVRAGSFSFLPGTSMGEVRRILLRESGMTLATLTIPEGWTLAQIANALEQASVVRADAFVAAAKVQPFVVEFPFLKDAPSDASLEGYLFPDTYEFFTNTEDAQSVVRRFLKRYGEVAPKEATFKTIILASIVEREVPHKEDRRVVADIFLTRLKIGIPLQADSTVNYITGGTSSSLSAQEVATDSLYNTYQHYGLPPGPISNPGFDAITAVLKPASSPYLYFLSGKDGTTHFARTLDEHNRNVQKYLRP
ncbi:MAG: endolytic transglycosylase MltG [bacterium]|nr:endolytic transglycosylase MltG [bacterium]